MPDKIIITEAAYSELVLLMRHIESKDGKSRVMKVYDDITKDIDRLLLFPQLGAIPRLKEAADKGYRFLVTHNILIFYYVQKHTVYVSAIIHGSQDYSKYKFY